MRRITVGVLALLVCLGALVGCTSSRRQSGAPSSPAPESSQAATGAASTAASWAVPANSSPLPVETAWRQYLGALISCDVPRLGDFRSDAATRSYAEGDVVHLCDSVCEPRLEVSGEEAIGAVTFHVVELVWSTGDRKSVDRDVQYVVRFRREADGVWRVAEMPDGVFTLR